MGAGGGRTWGSGALRSALGLYRDALTQKKDGFPCTGLNAGSYFITEDEAMYETHVETIEKALGARLIWTGSSHPLANLEARGVECFKR